MRQLDPHGRARLLVVLREIDGEFILGLERPADWRRIFGSLLSAWTFQAARDRAGPTAFFAGP